MKRILLGALVVVLLCGVAAFSHVRGLFVAARTPAEIDALLAPYDEVRRPEGAGPFPTVVFFHGCGGLRDSLRQWADQLAAEGFLVVATDSYAGRDAAWQVVCQGRKLLGAERAGDVWASLARVRAMPDVDPERVALMGWSHGSWSIMELFALDADMLPANLSEPPAAHFTDARALVLLYPYCGFGARATRHWPHAPKTLLLLAAEDTIVSAEACEQWGEGRAGVTTHVYPGVDHGFDQAIPSGDWPPSWDAQAGSDARPRVIAFLREQLR